MKLSLSKVAFFQNLPKGLLKQLDQMLVKKQFSSRAQILGEGIVNDQIFVLCKGSVQVRVDQETVAILDKPGEILGEMSAIEGRETTAELVAVDEVECMCIPPEGVALLKSNEKGLLEVYRSYSKSLSLRLIATNNKAKFVERTATQLAAAKDHLEKLNAKLEQRVVLTTAEAEAKQAAFDLGWVQFEEIVKGQGLALESIQSLHSDDIPFLTDELKTLRSTIPESRKEQVDKVLGRLDRLSQELEPVVSQLNEDLSMGQMKVLVVQSSRKDLMMIKMALAGLGVQIQAEQSVAKAMEQSEWTSCDLVLIDLENLPEAGKLNSRQYLIVADHQRSNFLEVLPQLESSMAFTSLPQGARAFVVKAWQGVTRSLISKSGSHMPHYLSRGAKIISSKIESSEHRHQVLDECIEHFSSYGVRRSYLDRIRTVGEELLMNAVYDAPLDENGLAKYNHWDRKITVKLEPHEQPELIYGSDGSVLAIGVVDPFGALQFSEFIEHIARCYRGEAGSVERKNKGGAGRGLHQIIENADLVSVSVKKHVFTQFYAFFHLDPLTEDLGPKVQLIFR